MTPPHGVPSPALFFFRQFLKSPRSVGSIIPTSAITVRALLDQVDWSPVRCAVEYGPGTGVFTRAILARLAPDARLIAIDTNPVFTDYLRSALPDPRLILVDGSAADVDAILRSHGFDHADYIVSGLPFSTIPTEIAQGIMRATAQAVRPGGAFLVYQYSLFVLPMLKTCFDHIDLRRAWFCIPPARLFSAWRKS